MFSVQGLGCVQVSYPPSLRFLDNTNNNFLDHTNNNHFSLVELNCSLGNIYDCAESVYCERKKVCVRGFRASWMCTTFLMGA